MKIALVHDYIKEYGGAERVLEVLSQMYPDAPIYTAFVDKKGTAYEKFKNKKIIPSWFGLIPFASRLASPLRFLTPFIWGSFDLSHYDLVISSASWYITKGFGNRKVLKQSMSNSSSSELKKRVEKFSTSSNNKSPIEICYCHTPPRWLYGYATSVNFQKYAIVRVYAALVGHFLRLYDFARAQKVNVFVANSEEVQARIEKFYRREAEVVYPPVQLEVPKVPKEPEGPKGGETKETKVPKGEDTSGASVSFGTSGTSQKKDYYFIVSRLVGGKGIEMAVEAAKKKGFNLKIAGSSAGYYSINTIQDLGFKIQENSSRLVPNGTRSNNNIEFLGQVSDEELVDLYKGAKAFLALSKDEDFGITPVEAMSCGTPVVAFNGGGYKETVVDGKTGVLFDEYSVEGLISAIKRFETLRQAQGSKLLQNCIKQAEKFNREQFEKNIRKIVSQAFSDNS